MFFNEHETINVVVRCSRNASHIIRFVLLCENNIVIKIGQFPSIADLSSYDVKKYRKVLGDKYVELTKAIGLASHGVGIGSFVYLRRIFEDLISKAFAKASQVTEWKTANASSFADKRIIEKILSLKDYLPTFLVENRNLYGIVSKGIHELTEEECLEYFPVIKAGIELILDDEIERISKEEKIYLLKRLLRQLKKTDG
ncbi:MAG: hypothetical protein LC768_12935 [Acidobacteria bacterium]|nr:hypothetical protein [Acidobacteriota bacterium]MCA1639216.1 hypothetical protein [Acidobacteriota bacterium]